METRNEVWRDVEGYEGYYQVSNFGRVRSVERVIYLHDRESGRIRQPQTIPGKILTIYNQSNGYCAVRISKAPFSGMKTVHRLVAKAFVPGYREGLEVNHKDENKRNNCADNLEWITSAENHAYGTARRRAKMNQKYRRPVIQMTLDGYIVKKWESINDASKQMGIARSNIRKACNGTYKKTHGYRWKFADE